MAGSLFGRLRALLERLRSTGRDPGLLGLDPSRGDLVVVVRGFDEVQACSAALDEAVAWRAQEPALLRHHLRLPPDQRPQAAAIAAQEDYAPAEGVEDGVLILQRVQRLDALHCAQERSRMVGLAQRLGGELLGWDGLQVPEQPPDAPGR